MIRLRFHFVFLLGLAVTGATAQTQSEPVRTLNLEMVASKQGNASPSTAVQSQGQEPVTLAALLQEALQKNPGVQSALRQVQAMRHRVPQAKTLPDPTLSVGWAGNITPFSVQKGD